MNWWRRARNEAAGAYRSVRYDLTKRSGPRHDTTDILYPEYDAYEPDDRSRRAATASGVGLVLAAAVVGVYLAVAGGMGALFAYGSPGSPASAGPSATARPSVTARPSSAAPAPAPAPSTASPAPSPSPSRTARATRTPTRRPTTRPPTTPPVPPPPTPDSASPTPLPSVTATAPGTGGEPPAEQH